jgi:hypothetical protein
MGAMVRTTDIVVRGSWDEAAFVRVAEGDDVPGLVTEAPTVEARLAKLEVMIPELFEPNGIAPPLGDDGEVSFLFVTRRATRPIKIAP